VLAEALEVSVRTIYRDIAVLQAAQVPIDGERGVGYILRDDYFLPPLRLSPIEREALAWGVAFVKAHGDADLSAAAIELEIKLSVGGQPGPATLPIIFATNSSPATRGLRRSLRAAVANRDRLCICYHDAGDVRTERTVRPLSLEHWGTVWTLTTWCETRADFRVFRVDRIDKVQLLTERFVHEPGKTMRDYIAAVNKQPASGAHAGPQ